MVGNFNSPEIETYTAPDGTEGWLDHVPTEEELAEDKRKQIEANESMRNQIAARQKELGTSQPPTKEVIDSLRSGIRVEGETKPDTDEVIADLRELFKN